jgi:Flp pilus assembly protein TadD
MEAALSAIETAVAANPANPELLLTRAIVSAALGRSAEAETALKAIEARWPEWERTYLVQGLLDEREGRLDKARQRVRTALALGSQEPAARCAAARLDGAPAAQCRCWTRVEELLLGACAAR